MSLKKYSSFFYFTIYSIFLINIVSAQSLNPQGISRYYFRFPLDIPMSLAANFGECRTDHFHMGLDIRTNQKENYSVYAAAEGYVYRIYINKNGFGNAIYIRHPNGYTTVYAHLNKFYTALQQYVEAKQYNEQQWEQDFILQPNQFPIYKSQFIAYSGNTGSSEGPHLHFEIRKTETDENINPMWFIAVSDYIKPSISRLVWYNRNISTYDQKPSLIKLKKINGEYTSIDSIVEIPASNISFGITSDDKSNTSNFNYGIYEALVKKDNDTISHFQLNKISYNDTRYINACIDYPYKIQTGKYIQHLSNLPGNHLSYFISLKNNGTININDDSIHHILITAADFNGNNSTINFYIKRKQPDSLQYLSTSNIILRPNNVATLNEKDIQITFPKNSLYDTVHLIYNRIINTNENAISPIFSIGSNTIPLHTNVIIQINPSKNLKTIDKNKNKIIAQYLSDKKPIAIKPLWEKELAKFQYNKLGDFHLIYDSIPPRIDIRNIKDSSNISFTKKIVIQAIDAEGDIQNFNALLDGKWLMFARKGDHFIYNVDDHCSLGYHTLICSVEDIAGNITSKSISFYRDDNELQHKEIIKRKIKLEKSKKLKSNSKKNYKPKY